MKRKYLLQILVFLSILQLKLVGQTGNNLVPFATGFVHPVTIANCGDNRLFIVCKTGYIYIIDSAGNTNPVPFLNIVSRVISTGSEQGLLGLAFHPEYPDSGYFYVNYIGAGDSTHISRFSVNPANPDLADASSEKKLMTIYQPYTNHNGGNVIFGPDGYLYLGLGDGGSGGDPGNRAQNLQDIHGKLLRIDVDHGNPYAIPDTNPYYNDPTGLDEIWDYGLRNPWRFSFDRLTGDLWIADVGQNLYEEIDFEPAGDPGGGNYGWRCYEANQTYNTSGCGSMSLYTFPIYQYSHSLGCSVSGGFVYRGSQFPGLYGNYFFADYCSDRVWTIHNEGGNWIAADFGTFTTNNFSTFGENAAGELFIAGYSSGTIYRVADNSAMITLNLKVYLEGPYSGSQMTTDLNSSGQIPLSQPYNTAPWNYTGTESVAAIPNANVVDWVLLELRDATSASSATVSTRIARQAAFLLNDGTIASINGSPGVQFNNFVNHQLFVIVWHRNHLGVMSANPLAGSNNEYSYDFTGSAGQYYGTNSGNKEIAPGVWGMVAGDSDANGIVEETDKNADWNAQAGESGYSNSDFNMNDEVDNSDKDDWLIPNYLRASQIPF